MDLYQGAVALPNQVHDFNPGIPPSGLFWTQPVSEEALDVDLEEGKATLAVANLDEEDYHNLQNALVNGPSDPATVSFKMRWTATAPVIRVTDPVHHFRGRFRISTVTIEWSAKNEKTGFEFVSDPAGTTVNVMSVMGRERNGLFFSEGAEADD
jgi:hypothetical protein